MLRIHNLCMQQTAQVSPLNFNQQRLSILRCTAKALANSPGGLRFKSGTQPWLDDLKNNRRMRPVAGS